MTQTWDLLQTGQKEGYKIAYTNARIIDPETKLDIKGSLLTEGDKIVDFGESLFSTSGVDETIDCKGLVLMPGLLTFTYIFVNQARNIKKLYIQAANLQLRGELQL